MHLRAETPRPPPSCGPQGKGSVWWMKWSDFIPLIDNCFFGTHCMPVLLHWGWGSSLPSTLPPLTGPCPGLGLCLPGRRWVNTPRPRPPAPSIPGLNKGLLLMSWGGGWERGRRREDEESGLGPWFLCSLLPTYPSSGQLQKSGWETLSLWPSWGGEWVTSFSERPVPKPRQQAEPASLSLSFPICRVGTFMSAPMEKCSVHFSWTNLFCSPDTPTMWGLLSPFHLSFYCSC